MGTYRYLLLDVFTDRAFRGNQLAVFPEAVGLDAGHMQQLARELNLSESAFVFDADASDVDARVRIFAPARELPTAGHPTIGTTFALASERSIVPPRSVVTLGLGVGPTPVSLEWQGPDLRFAWMTQPIPAFGATPLGIGRLARALGIAEREIGHTGLPVQEVSSGVPFLFVPAVSREAVNRVRVDRSVLRAFFESQGLPELPVFVFSLARGQDDATAFSRMFAPVFGIPEDPATGGASGPLGGYLVHHQAIDGDTAAHMVSLQGVAMGRPSHIHIAVTSQDGRISDVRVGGGSVVVGRGSMAL